MKTLFSDIDCDRMFKKIASSIVIKSVSELESVYEHIIDTLKLGEWYILKYHYENWTFSEIMVGRLVGKQLGSKEYVPFNLKFDSMTETTDDFYLSDISTIKRMSDVINNISRNEIEPPAPPSTWDSIEFTANIRLAKWYDFKLWHPSKNEIVLIVDPLADKVSTTRFNPDDPTTRNALSCGFVLPDQSYVEKCMEDLRNIKYV